MGKTLKAGPPRINGLRKLETFSILASTGGTVAALISQQTALAILPFSFSLSLGWWNRREQLTQIRSQKTVIERLETEVSRKHTELDKVLLLSSSNWEDRLQTLSQAFQQRTEPQQIAQARQEIALVQNSLQTFSQNLTQVEQTQNDQSSGLNTLKSSAGEINSRLSQFGVGLSNLQHSLQTLSQTFEQRIELAQIAQATQEIGQVKNSLRALRLDIEDLQKHTTHKHTSNQGQFEFISKELSRVERYVRDSVNALENSSVEMNSTLSQFEDGLYRSIESIEQQLDKVLSDSLSGLQGQRQETTQNSQEITAIQNSLMTLRQRVNNLQEQTLVEIDTRLSQFDAREYQWLEQQFNQLNLCLKSIDHKYELVCDRGDSRKKLLEAIDTAEERLILVCPWPAYGLSHNRNEVYHKLFNFLKDHPKAILDIGWGHLKNINESGGNPSLESLSKHSNMYNSVPLLRKLQNRFPDRCRLKILGTHEKFIVCDHHFGFIGSHNFLTSGPENSERELGIYTTNPSIIYEMLRRFDQAPDLGMTTIAQIKNHKVLNPF